MEFSYKFEFTRDHFLELQKYIWARMLNDPSTWKGQKAISLSLSFAIAAFAVFLIDLLGSQLTIRMGVSLSIAIVLFIGWFFAIRIFQTYVAGTGLSETGTILGIATLSISDNGISQVGARYRFDCSWEAVSDVLETPNLVVFLTDPVKGIVFPRTAVPDDEYDTLLAFSRERIAR